MSHHIRHHPRWITAKMHPSCFYKRMIKVNMRHQLLNRARCTCLHIWGNFIQAKESTKEISKRCAIGKWNRTQVSSNKWCVLAPTLLCFAKLLIKVYQSTTKWSTIMLSKWRMISTISSLQIKRPSNKLLDTNTERLRTEWQRNSGRMIEKEFF